MGYWAKATISFGFDVPDNLNADWLESDAPEEEGTRLVQDRCKYWKHSPEIIVRPKGGYRLVLVAYSVSGNAASAPIADGALDIDYEDAEALRDVAKHLGWNPSEDNEPNWVLSSQYM